MAEACASRRRGAFQRFPLSSWKRWWARVTARRAKRSSRWYLPGTAVSSTGFSTSLAGPHLV